METREYSLLNNLEVQSSEQLSIYKESNKIVHKYERLFLASPLIIFF
jgi:hypothetical protein